MSKVNRRKEIQQKEALQAKFQHAMAQTNTKVSLWLQPYQSETTTTAKDTSFHNLPIIPAGSGLQALEDDKHHKIGDFISGNETGLRKLKVDESNAVAGSRAMNALMNKMRKETRQKPRVEKPARVSVGKVKPKAPPKKVESDSDSDDNLASHRGRSVQKGTNLLFEKRTRPF